MNFLSERNPGDIHSSLYNKNVYYKQLETIECEFLSQWMLISPLPPPPRKAEDKNKLTPPPPPSLILNALKKIFNGYL